MTWKCRSPKQSRMIQLSADGSQTGAANGDKIEMPTKITTGVDSVSITSAGVMSFSSSKSYYISVHVDLDRSNSSSNFSAEWWNETTNAKLDRTSGAFEAKYLPPSSSGTGTHYNGSTLGQIILINPTHTLSVRIAALSSGSTVDIQSDFHVFIIEIDELGG